MVAGLERFAEHFRDLPESYILIGGVACDLWMARQGAPFRATRDLDIVIVVEALQDGFVKRFWEFCREGRYQVRERASGAPILYRFAKPLTDASRPWPAILELFARSPFGLEATSAGGFTPIPAGEDGSSLSAILMDEPYYRLVRSTAGHANDLSVPLVPATTLAVLKARAWLDLRARRERGEGVDKTDIKKHRNDVFRLLGTLTEADRTRLEEPLAGDMRRFVAALRGESPETETEVALSLRQQGFSLGTALQRLSDLFDLGRT